VEPKQANTTNCSTARRLHSSNSIRALGDAFRRRSNLYLLLALSLTGCGKAVPPGPSVRESLDSSEIAPHRVTATIKRQAAELVHVQTERGTLVTTPEHPFAKAGWGWVAARELRPHDLVISARFGTVGVTSVRTEELAEPVAVFNLTVDRTHAYLVGNDEVLVHNDTCGPSNPQTIAQLQTRLNEAQRELRALRAENPTSPEQRERNAKRMAELNKEIYNLQAAIRKERERDPGAELREAEAQLQAISGRLAELRERLRLLEEANPQRPEETDAVRAQIADLAEQEASRALDVDELREI
jgi:hypothetical protein